MKRKKHSETPKAKQPLSEPIARRELVLLAAILTIGASLRIATVATSAVEHFDEGVYASNIYFGPPDYSYPMLRFYAPPLLPALIAVSYTHLRAHETPEHLVCRLLLE